ncbi:retrovirus-related Pol polyprotein from transposon TNT 1-94 [Trichonephila clavipes]|nr:retrovirus-related Pol polyprotein from transposon TNT 1-94 [Trichonephila clavipes]
MEAEFIAMTLKLPKNCCGSIVLGECFETNVITGQRVESILHVDNRTTIDFVRSRIENYRSKHIDVKLFFVRDSIYKDIFELEFVRSKDNLADIFTKPLTKTELRKFITLLFTKNEM